MSYSLGVQTHAAIIARVHRSVPTNLMPNAKRMRALVYPIQPSLFIRVIGFIASSSQKTGLTARFVDVLPLTKRSGDDGKGIRVRWVARETARIHSPHREERPRIESGVAPRGMAKRAAFLLASVSAG